ncbi:MAG TPA: tetratricopeptide repeat protein [Casimicrobiaceae bacterium]|nr:tetratricopeptide repeat protein [Casimicrobiaceae bacterium]
MKCRSAVLATLLLASCASAPPAPRDERFFRDSLFQSPSAKISADQVFALSPDMVRYLHDDIEKPARVKGRQNALFEALYRQGDLKLEYDSSMTRTAAEAFAAKSGNCLSLVIMTAALAKALDLPVEYHKVIVDEEWSRSGDIYAAAGHVNLTLLHHRTDDVQVGYRVGKKPPESNAMTIDFLPPEDIRGQHLRPIGEDVVIAMFMNNRAVESLAHGRRDDAYWYAREAIVQSPGYMVPYNTLGAVYDKHGNLPEAEAVLRFVLSREPANTQAMANLVTVLADLGKLDESRKLAVTLDRLEPEPPFGFYKRGMAAMRAGDLTTAKAMFERELARQPDYHEFHFWLAVVDVGLGNNEEARKHLKLAMRNSTTRSDQDLYAAKLDRLNAIR